MLWQGPENAASLTALFTFVAKDQASMKATEVNPLQPSTEEERQAFQQRQDLADARKAARKQQASTPPGTSHGHSDYSLECSCMVTPTRAHKAQPQAPVAYVTGL